MGNRPTSSAIIDRARSAGASMAGIADLERLRDAPSHTNAAPVPWRGEGSILVLALVHPPEAPELDWWDGDKGTPGNRRLIETAGILKAWLRAQWGISARSLPYHVEKGGIFLKDAAVLAGLGAIGANNLLVTPGFGTRVRLRALFLDRVLNATGPIPFSPCDGCPMPCRRACPRDAFHGGAYDRSRCALQMAADEAGANPVHPAAPEPILRSRPIRYCRACEQSCPKRNAPPA